MKSKATLLLLIFTLTLAASQLQAGSTFRLEQDTDRDGYYETSYGVVSPYATSQTLYDFYGHPNFAGETSAVANSHLIRDRSNMFLIQSADGLGLVIVHNKYGASDGDGNGGAEMGLTFESPSGVSIERKDDHQGVDGTGIYFDQFSGTSKISAQWLWGDNYTDGLAVAWNPTVLNEATIRFTDVDDSTEFKDPNSDNNYTQTISDTIDDWVFYSNGSSEPITMNLDADQPIRLTMLPLPPAAWPAVAMLGVLALRRLRSRRLNESEELR